MNAEQWKADYEAAFRAANGTAATVTNLDPGWYGIERESGNRSLGKYRKSAIVEMTARLEQRVRDEGAKS